MKKISLIVLFLGCMLAHAQFLRPDYPAIQKAISDPKSEFYYPTLLERYRACDTTLTAQQRLHLYYGFVFQKEYDPYDHSDTEMKKMLHALPSIGDNDCRTLIKMAQEVLEKNPFKVSAFRVIQYCCDQLDSAELAYKYAIQQHIFALALIESGNGMNPSTAFYVNEVEHEYFLLSLYDLTPGSQSLAIINDEKYDILEVDKNDYGLEKLYFNLKSFSFKK